MSSMQISVPHSKYGRCSWFVPGVIDEWLRKQGLYGSFCGTRSSGDGYTDGKSNGYSVYMVNNVQETDSIAFKIMFPECEIHCSTV